LLLYITILGEKREHKCLTYFVGDIFVRIINLFQNDVFKQV